MQLSKVYYFLENKWHVEELQIEKGYKNLKIVIIIS